MIIKFIIKRKDSGLTLIESLIGMALLLIVFLGIFGLIQFGMRMILQSKIRTTALALANQKLELAHNLTYQQVGTTGGIPSGSIPETETITRNHITYTAKTTVFYVDDPFDGMLPDDPLAWDYKRVKVKVSWSGNVSGELYLQTDIAPKGIETTGGGGIISILVFNANGGPVPQANINIVNNFVSPPINANYQTDNQGQLFVPGAPACNDCYKISATKFDYSSDRTYANGELVRGIALVEPSKPLLSVIEGQLSEISFSIDQLSSKTVKTIRYVEEKSWSDSFVDETKISDKYQVVVNTASSSAELAQQDGQYYASGYLISTTITPSGLAEWGRLTFNHQTLPITEIKYQILYFNGSNWVLIPDDDLTVNGVKNSDGFTSSPVELLELNAAQYRSLRLRANFSTTDLMQTPVLDDWSITWFSSDTSIPVPNIAFNLRGAKILGLDSNHQPVYKYEENLSTNSNGENTISNLEWDSYEITINGASTGYDLANSSPPQPVNINPNTDFTTTLKLAPHQTNTCLITVKDSSGQSIIGASVKLYRTGYSKTKLSSDSGQAFFSPLNTGTYNLEVKAAGFTDYAGQIDIAGQFEQIIIMILP
jgi:hypothetical protein